MSIIKAVAGLTFIAAMTAIVAGSALSLVRGRAEAAAAATAERSLPAFDKIHLSGVFSTKITAGASQRVTITAAPDVLSRVTTTVRDGMLEVGLRNGTNTSGTIHVDIALEHLHGFNNGGAGSSTIAGIHDDITIENAGAGSITASGHATTVTISLSGVGKIDASKLAARDVTADNDGVGSVAVCGSGHLTLTVNGVGEIRYAGSPQHVDKNVNGIGRIAAM